MAMKHDLVDWVRDAVARSGGSATLVEVARDIWDKHESELRALRDLFYTWQYDMRWAAQTLRDTGKFKPTGAAQKGRWELAGSR
jgi:hypothetical protein